MLVEVLLILASCDVKGVALGSCVSSCPKSSGASFTICAERTLTSSVVKPKPAPKPVPVTRPIPKPIVVQKPVVKSVPVPKPRRLCSYYVNGTIDIPTSSIITAWIDVGSRACIGDPTPKAPVRAAAPAPVAAPVAKIKTVSELTTEAFTAHATAPFAYLRPNGEVEVFQSVNFGVDRGGGEHVGELFGEPATIRFVAIEIAWSFSDGQRLSGQFVSTSFGQPAQIRASAEVRYRIDYRRPGGSWILAASHASLVSNQLTLVVIDPPRRTLLVD